MASRVDGFAPVWGWCELVGNLECPPAASPEAPPCGGPLKWPARLLRSRSSVLQIVRMRIAWAAADLSSSLLEQCRQEYEQGSLFNLVPVFLAVGIAIYFAAPAEPAVVFVALGVAAPALAATRLSRHRAAYHLAIAFALVSAGMLMAQFRSHYAGGPVLQDPVSGIVRGVVINQDKNSRGHSRYLIRPEAIEGIAETALPKRIRLSAASQHQPLQPGDPISGAARLLKVPGPTYPGGYDFAFFSGFEGLGATGYFTGEPERPSPGIEGRSLAETARIQVNLLRRAIADRIEAQIDPPFAAIAVALITGDRSGIGYVEQESLRRSGLAHILAISGLHMALVTMTVLAVARAVLALSPHLTLYYPIRKWSAAAALVTATAYLVVSGGAVATQRAWIMVAVMLCGVLADRSALTMRNVAIAAIIVLTLSPESLLEPGFQMSFSATAALVAAYGALSRRTVARLANGEGGDRGHGLLSQVGRFFGAILFTSLVAGVATGLFSAWHFHQIAPFGLLTNFAAMPIVTFAVMPLALSSAILMPYGVEFLALKPLGWSIAVVCAIAGKVNEITPSGNTGMLPDSLLLCGASALILLTLLRSRLRLLALAPLAAMPFLAIQEPPPDLIVSENGGAIGMRDPAGRLALLFPNRDRFTSAIWLRAWSRDTPGDRASLIQFCDSERCIAATQSGMRVEIVYNPDLLQESCLTADVLIAPYLRWVRCRERWPAVVVNRFLLNAKGATTVRIRPPAATASESARLVEADRDWDLRSRLAIEHARPAGQRPWN
jgi:competence protein ComEC